MYNRYVQNSDGSFQKIKLPEPDPEKSQFTDKEIFNPPLTLAKEEKQQAGTGILSFFRNLIPGGLDTEDLIVILLLLLISQNHEKGGNQALLTIGAYLFL